jgi:RNA12 protein
LTEWASVICQYRIAHIVFVSDNPAAVRAIGKVLPNKSLETITLSDASPETAMNYVQRRLFKTRTFAPEELKPALAGLGGRLNDLEMLIQKINAGRTPNGIIVTLLFAIVILTLLPRRLSRNGPSCHYPAAQDWPGRRH